MSYIENFKKGLEGGNTKVKIKASGKYDVDNLNEEAFVFCCGGSAGVGLR